MLFSAMMTACCDGGPSCGGRRCAGNSREASTRPRGADSLRGRSRKMKFGRMHDALLEDILRLPVDERIRLVERIWDSIAATPEAVPVTDVHKNELDHRLDDPAPGPGLRWEEVQELLRKRG